LNPICPGWEKNFCTALFPYRYQASSNAIEARLTISGQRGRVRLGYISFRSGSPDVAVKAIAIKKTGRAYFERCISNISAAVIMMARRATTTPAPHDHQSELAIGLPSTFMDPFGMSEPSKNIVGTRLIAVSHFRMPGIALRFRNTMHQWLWINYFASRQFTVASVPAEIPRQ
jgi:hypothetical protein